MALFLELFFLTLLTSKSHDLKTKVAEEKKEIRFDSLIELVSQIINLSQEQVETKCKDKTEQAKF